jgi:opacity protein-like surface antigen
MQLKTAVIVLALLQVSAADAGAQKWELSAFGGYRWGGELSDGSYESSTGTLNFEDGACWGLTAGYNINPRFEIELLYDRQHTSLRFEYERVGADTTFGDGKVDYIMAGLSVNLLEEDYKLMPYFSLYLGATRIVPDDSSSDSSWYTAAGYALGVTYFFTENLGAMVENRGTSTILTSQSTLVCTDTDDCVTIPADTWMWQIGLSLGVVVTF